MLIKSQVSGSFGLEPVTLALYTALANNEQVLYAYDENTTTSHKYSDQILRKVLRNSRPN